MLDTCSLIRKSGIPARLLLSLVLSFKKNKLLLQHVNTLKRIISPHVFVVRISTAWIVLPRGSWHFAASVLHAAQRQPNLPFHLGILVFHLGLTPKLVTSPKFNSEFTPEKMIISKGNHRLPIHHFSGAMLNEI